MSLKPPIIGGISTSISETVLPPDESEMLSERPVGARRQVLVAIPAFNEERFIGSVVLRAGKAGFPVLVVDDGSDDDTAAIAAAAGARVERHPTNLGKAQAINTALAVARKQNADALVVLDGDGQHDADEIERVLEPVLAGDADIAIGSRFLPGSDGEVPAVRRVGQRLVTGATNLISGARVTDSQSGFRAFSRRAIQALFLRSAGYGGEVEMQFHARDHALRLAEVPCRAIYSDPPKRPVLEHGTRVLNQLLQLSGRHRPLLFFSIPGIVLVLLGLVAGSVISAIYSATHVLAVGYALLSVLLIVCGLLACFTGLVLHAVRGAFLDLDQRLRSLGDAGEGLWGMDQPCGSLPVEQRPVA